MTLSTEQPWAKNGYGPGIYIGEATIVAVENMAGVQTPFMQTPFDIGMRLTLDIGRDFQPQLVIAGNFKRNPASGEVSGWGSAFVVQEALTRLGFQGHLSAENTIPEEVFDGLVGQRIYRLSYVSGTKENGKLKYCDWNQIATLDEGPDDLASRFRHSLTRGYPKNFRPSTPATPEPKSVITEETVDPF